MILSEKINVIDELWFLGNNRTENNKKLKIENPSFVHPLFLTNNLSYANDYSDYGCHVVIFDSNYKSSILDFKNKTMCKKLGWPELMISSINSGESDMNSIVYDMYHLLAFLIHPEYLKNNYRNKILKRLNYLKINKMSELLEWIKVTKYFQTKYVPKFKIDNQEIKNFDGDQDEKFLRFFYLDIVNSGFDGFFKEEFNKKNFTLALFDIEQMDLISNTPIDMDKVDEILSNTKLKTKKQLVNYINKEILKKS